MYARNRRFRPFRTIRRFIRRTYRRVGRLAFGRSRRYRR